MCTVVTGHCGARATVRGILALLGHMRMGVAVFVANSVIDRDPAFWAVRPLSPPEEGRLGCVATGPLGTERRRQQDDVPV